MISKSKQKFLHIPAIVRVFLLVLAFLIPSYVVAVVITGNVKFLGNLAITGSLTKGSGTFVIDHPLDSKNKLLFHSFVESPDVKNLYDGIATLNQNGEAVIKLPNYFEALNKDFRYQVKPVDKSAPNLYIKEEVKDNKFTIAGGVPGQKISWQVTGTRQDPYILANPIIVEVENGPDALVNKVEYLHSGVYEVSKVKDFFSAIITFFQSFYR